MATVVLGTIGAVVGAYAGDPMLGFQVGVAVGSAIDASRNRPKSVGRLTDLHVAGSQYGAAIPQVFGAFRLPLNIIWVKLDASGNGLVETRHKHGGASSLIAPQPTTYTYSSSFAGLVCRGPVGVRRIWAADRTIFDLYADPPSAYTLRLYRGDETQLQDPLIASSMGGANQVPAYRGSCYIVFESLPLQDWSNALPNPLSAEVDFTYPELIFSHPSLQSYFRFENETGKLTDIGPKGFTLADVSPASTFVAGCFQALNGAAGGGRGIKIGNNTKILSRVTGSVPEFNTGKFTLEWWYKWNGTDGGGRNELAWENPNNGDEAFEFSVQHNLFTSQTVVQLENRTVASGATTSHNYAVTADQNWHHALVSYDQAGNTLLYVDGALVSTLAAPVNPATIIQSAQNILELGGGDYSLDEVAIYSDTLTAADALAHFSKGVSG